MKSFAQFQADAKKLAPADHHVRCVVEAWEAPRGKVSVAWGVGIIGPVGTTAWYAAQGATPEDALAAIKAKLPPPHAAVGPEHLAAVDVDLPAQEKPSFEDFVNAIRGAPDGESMSFRFDGGRVDVVKAEPVKPGDPLSAAVAAPPVVHELRAVDAGSSSDEAST